MHTMIWKKSSAAFSRLAATEMALGKVVFSIYLMGVKLYCPAFDNCLVSRMSLKSVEAAGASCIWTLRAHVTPLALRFKVRLQSFPVPQACNSVSISVDAKGRAVLWTCQLLKCMYFNFYFIVFPVIKLHCHQLMQHSREVSRIT